MTSSGQDSRATRSLGEEVARIMDASELAEGLPPEPLADPPVVVASQVHLAQAESAPVEPKDSAPVTRTHAQSAISQQAERLKAEIQEMRAMCTKLAGAARAHMRVSLADIEAKQIAAREKLDELTLSTGEAWVHLRHGAKHAWEELERAVRKARSEF